MPRYFFNIREGDTYIADSEGGNFPDLDAAMSEACEIAREFIIARLKAREKIDGRIIEITDGSGPPLATLPVRDILKD